MCWRKKQQNLNADLSSVPYGSSLTVPCYICRHGWFFPFKNAHLYFHFPLYITISSLSFNQGKRGILHYNGQVFHAFSFWIAQEFLKQFSWPDTLTRNNAVFCPIRYIYCFIPCYLNFGPCCTQGCGKKLFVCDFSILYVQWKYRLMWPVMVSI